MQTFRNTPSPPNYYVIPPKNDATTFGIFSKCDLVNDYFFFYITDLYEYDLSLPYFDDRVINSLTDIIVVAQDIIDIIALLDLALTVISNKILRELKILCLLFNKSLRKKKKSIGLVTPPYYHDLQSS
jgi:hypothetical protein